MPDTCHHKILSVLAAAMLALIGCSAPPQQLPPEPAAVTVATTATATVTEPAASSTAASISDDTFRALLADLAVTGRAPMTGNISGRPGPMMSA